MRTLVLLSILSALSLACRPEPAEPPPPPVATTPGEREVERMLAALGGRERWAALERLEVHAYYYFDISTPPIPVTQWRDFAGGRMRVEQDARGSKHVLVLSDEGAWSLNDGNLAALDETLLGRYRDSERRNLYRLLRALARREGVTAALDDGSRLEIRATGEQDELLCVITLDESGRPLRSQTPEREGTPGRTYHFLAWGETEGYGHPQEYRQDTGGATFENTDFLPNGTFDDDLFAGPRSD